MFNWHIVILIIIISIYKSETNLALLCTQNVCSRVNCPILNCSNGRIEPHGSYCGCCSSCIKFLDENDHCFDFHSGTQPIKECRPGLVCNKKTNKCELLKCFDQLKKLNKNDTNSILIPNCKPDGTFAPRQCNKTSCYCVSFHGQLLTQFKSSSIDSKRYCHCAQLFNGNISWKTRCDKYGDYLLVQCKGKICYCVNLDGKILKNMEFFSRTKSVENEQYCLNLQKKKGIKTI